MYESVQNISPGAWRGVPALGGLGVLVVNFTHDQLLAVLPNLKKFALRLTKNTANAEDLVQDTVLRMLDKQAMFTEGSNLFSWGSKIMFNLFASRYRHVKKFDTQYDPEPEIMAMSVDQRQDDIVYYKQVLEQVKKLPRDMRVMIYTVVDLGSYEAAADALDVPVGTVRSRLSRARDRIENALEPLKIAGLDRLRITGGADDQRR